ncbi:hypothetical protein GYH30_035524 [Glycine max]|nr:hypothetical protein GYH30_035524 [Glycine max]
MVDLCISGHWLFSALGFLIAEFKHGGSDAQFWFACIVGPLEVWIRWFLAWFNGFGSGRTGILKGIPFGTLAANKSAAGVMAALASVHKAASF